MTFIGDERMERAAQAAGAAMRIRGRRRARRRARHTLFVAVVASSATVIVALLFTSSAFAAFGITQFTASAMNDDSTLDTQAGSHPYEAATSFTFNHAAGAGFGENAVGFVKDVEVELPVGFVGDPQASPHAR
jgi:hypothetical protein